MNRKRWVRLIFILLPLIIVLIQILWQVPANRSYRLKMAIRGLIPPIGIVFHYFDFNQKNALSQWEEKVFQGRVAYWIDFDKSSGFVHSNSNRSASAIFYRIKFDISDYPYVSWKWRVGKFPDKSKVTDPKKRDDFAARFYIVFAGHFFTHFHCIEYVWDESLSEGTVLESPYSEKIKQWVIQSGTNPFHQWVTEGRNVFEDYKKLFGETPKMKVAAIALMTDSEGTEGEAEGFFDDIQIGKGK